MKKNRLAVMAAIAFAVAACNTAPTYVPVDRPVPIKCDVPAPAAPVFPADALTGEEDIFTKVTILWADRLARIAYIWQLEPLKGCTNAP